MQINLTGHHVDITDSLRNYVNEKMGKLERHFDKVSNTHVILTLENLDHKAEATVHMSGNDIFAEASETDMYAAIDSLVDNGYRGIVIAGSTQRVRDVVPRGHHPEVVLAHRTGIDVRGLAVLLGRSQVVSGAAEGDSDVVQQVPDVRVVRSELAAEDLERTDLAAGAAGQIEGVRQG